MGCNSRPYFAGYFLIMHPLLVVHCISFSQDGFLIFCIKLEDHLNAGLQLLSFWKNSSSIKGQLISKFIFYGFPLSSHSIPKGRRILLWISASASKMGQIRKNRTKVEIYSQIFTSINWLTVSLSNIYTFFGLFTFMIKSS